MELEGGLDTLGCSWIFHAILLVWEDLVFEEVTRRKKVGTGMNHRLRLFQFEVSRFGV